MLHELVYTETAASIRYLKIPGIMQWCTNEMLGLKIFQKVTKNFTLNADTGFLILCAQQLLKVELFNQSDTASLKVEF